ncbi:uncharacterized protein LOC112539609 [Tetranychus urticae]|uniref:uncharacterized protein LOC112539609 n=1 Tax=Tetranychus urticae TaxID=32264 RepID=UPI000D64122B|nr:uncharacterized protein LOC112539609 [Tetranychus urticae]
MTTQPKKFFKISNDKSTQLASQSNNEGNEPRHLIATIAENFREPNNIKTLYYDRKEDFIDWFEMYEYETTAVGWNDKDRLKGIAQYLDGTARRWYVSYASPDNPDAPKTYYDLKQMMVRDLCRADYRSIIETRLYDCKQEKGESVANYILEKQELCKRVDSKMPEPQVLRHILRGLLPELLQYIDQFEIKDVSALLQRANIAESTHERQLNEQGLMDKTSLEKVFSDLRKSVEVMNERLTSMTIQNPSRLNTNPTQRPVECNYCKKLGHVYKYCRKRIYDAKQRQGNNGLGQSNQTQNMNYKSNQTMNQQNNRWTKPKVINLATQTPSLSMMLTFYASLAEGKFIFMNIEIESKKFQALVDTGSDVTIITRKVANSIGKNPEYYQGPLTGTACNIPISPVGQVDVILNLKGENKDLAIETTVLVVDYLPANIEILLGQDVSWEADLYLGIRQKSVYIGHGEGEKARQVETIEVNPYTEEEEESESLPDSWEESDVSEDESSQVEPQVVNLVTNQVEIKSNEKFNLDESLTKEQSICMLNLIQDYRDVFSFPNDKLGCTHLVQHQINTEDNPPIHQPPYRLSPVKRDLAQAMINELVEEGFVVPSNSPWASPIVIVDKKTGDKRFCVDYRKLNAITKKDVYPLPDIQLALDCLQGAQYFSLLDLKSGYYQIAMDPKDQEKTAFVTQDGLYEFTVPPFGLPCAPATFH